MLSGESLFGSACGRQKKTHIRQRFRNTRRGWIETKASSPVDPIRTSEQALDGEEDGADVVGGGPLVLEDVEADVAVDVDVGVEAGGVEPHLGRLVRVVGGEGEPEAVGGSLVGGAGGPGDGAHPVEDVVALREGRHARVAAHHQRHQLRLQPPHHRLALRAAPGPRRRRLRRRSRGGRGGDVARLRVAVLAASHGRALGGCSRSFSFLSPVVGEDAEDGEEEGSRERERERGGRGGGGGALVIKAERRLVCEPGRDDRWKEGAEGGAALDPPLRATAFAGLQRLVWGRDVRAFLPGVGG